MRMHLCAQRFRDDDLSRSARRLLFNRACCLFLILFLSLPSFLLALDAPAPPVSLRERALAHPTTGTRRPYIVLLARLTLVVRMRVL